MAWSSRGRSAGSPTTSPRVASTVSISRRTSPARRSASSTRTTTTARTTSTASGPRWARSTRTRTSSPRRRSSRRRRSVRAQITRIKAAVRQILAVFQLPTPTSRTIATAKALGLNLDQIYMNYVAAIKPAMDGMVAALGAAVRQRASSRPLRQGSAGPEVGQRRRHEALQIDHRQVRRGRERERPAGLLRSREGRGVRPGSVQGRAKSHPRGADERASEHELSEQARTCSQAW